MSKHTDEKKSQTAVKQSNKLGVAPQAPKAGQSGHN